MANELAVNALEDASISLLQRERFYGHLILNMRRVITNKIPTAAVSIDKSGVNLMVNPDFFLGLSPAIRVDVLKHETLHITNGHIPRFLELMDINNTSKSEGQLKKLLNGQRFNIAADMAINQYIPNLSKEIELKNPDGTTRKFTPVKLIEGFDPCETMEYYYSKLKEEENKDKDKGEGQNGEGNSIDDHSLWSSSEVDAETAKHMTKEILQKTVGQTEEGQVPNDVRLYLDKLCAAKVNWKTELRRFVANSTDTILEYSRKVRNRRYGLLHPGVKTYPKVAIAAAWDTSGSMWSEELQQEILNELNAINKNDVEITIIMCDTQVTSVEKFNPKMKVELKGGGGTLYQPALDEGTKRKVDGLIYFGDMECFDTELIKPKYRVLWCGTKGSKRPTEKFGSFVEIK